MVWLTIYPVIIWIIAMGGSICIFDFPIFAVPAPINVLK